MPKSTLEHLHAQEALAKAKLIAARRRLLAMQRRKQAAVNKLTQQRREEVGRLVEELGMPMDVDTLRPIFQEIAAMAPWHRANGTSGPSNGALSGNPSLRSEEAHLAGNNLLLDHAEIVTGENHQK